MTELRVRRRGATGLDPVNEGNPLPVQEMGDATNRYVEFESVTVSTAAIGLTAAKYESATNAFITVETASVRYATTWNTVPTSSVGHQLDAGDTLTLESADEIADFRVIRMGGADATLRVSYGR